MWSLYTARGRILGETYIFCFFPHMAIPRFPPQTSPAGVDIVGSPSALVAFTRQTRTPLGRGKRIPAEEDRGRT